MANDAMRPDEPLIEGVAGLPHGDFLSPVPPDVLRDKVWQRTASVVRARPGRRRVYVAGYLVAAYVAGLGTFHVLGERVPPPEVRAPGPEHSTGEDELPADPRGLDDKLQGVAADEKQQLLKSAGDRYLSERLDVASALHCYRRLLNTEDPSSRRLRGAGESWLLSALRHARELEVIHEKADG